MSEGEHALQGNAQFAVENDLPSESSSAWETASAGSNEDAQEVTSIGNLASMDLSRMTVGRLCFVSHNYLSHERAHFNTGWY